MIFSLLSTKEIDVAKAVNAPIFVVTDTVDTYWINTLTGEKNYIRRWH